MDTTTRRGFLQQELKEHGQFLRKPERSISPETAAKVMRTEKYAELAERWRKVRPRSLE